ncbi:MAG: hypothetical protein ACRD2Y_11940, partial [Terriglobales bacterium]
MDQRQARGLAAARVAGLGRHGRSATRLLALRPGARDGTIEVHQFKRYQEKSGYWLYCDYRIRGMFTYTLQIEGAT